MNEEKTQTEVIDQDNDSAPFDDSQTDKPIEEKVSEEALKASEDFDKKLDEEGVVDEETKPSEDDKTGDEKNAADKASEEDNAADEKAKAEAEAKAAKEKEGEQETDDSVLSDGLLTRAVQAGLNLEEAKSFNSAKALETTLGHIERASQKDNDTTTKDKTVTEEEGYKPFELKPFELKFEKEDEIDPDILTAMKGMNDHYKTQIEAMNSHNAEQFKGMTTQMQSVQGGIANQASLTFEKDFDSMVKAVEADYEAELGKGTGRSLGKDSAQMANRMKVINTMHIINKTYSDRGEEAPPRQDAFNQAVTMVFADKAKELTTKKTVSKLTQRSKQAIGKPSGQKGNLSPDDKAVEISKEFDAKIDAEEES